MTFFEECAQLVRTGLVYIVDTANGTYKEFTLREFEVVAGILDHERFARRMSLESALELCKQIETAHAGRS